MVRKMGSHQFTSQQLEAFSRIPKIKLWRNVKAPENKQTTLRQYTIFLMRYLGKEKPGQFLKRCDQDPKAVSIEVKARLGELYAKSNTTAKQTKYALKSFLEAHEKTIQLNGKMRIHRTRKIKTGDFKWEEAEKVISFTDEPYRSLFTFQMWSGLGEDEIMEIQNSQELQTSIETQRSQGYVRIDLEPRKSTLDEFFTIVPFERVPTFPVKTRTGQPVSIQDMESIWRRAAIKAKLYKVGLGPHKLRTVFRSQCGKADVAPAVAEFFMGHGSGDKYGYDEEALDEEYALKEIGKFWTYNKAGSREAYDDLQTQIKDLTEWKKKYEPLIRILEKEYKA
jgi:hypothetical protein